MLLKLMDRSSFSQSFFFLSTERVKTEEVEVSRSRRRAARGFSDIVSVRIPVEWVKP